MRSTECLDCPDLHLSETLTTELCLTTKWLLSDERVRTDRTSVHLVLYHVTELQEVCDTDCSRLVEHLTCLTIIKVCRAVAWETCLVSPLVKVIKLSTIEDRSSELNTELLTCCTKYSLEDLTEVHSRRHTQRVQYQVNWTTILEEWHILLTNNLRYDTLVTVTTSELITYTDLTLLSDINLSHLLYA